MMKKLLLSSSIIITHRKRESDRLLNKETLYTSSSFSKHHYLIVFIPIKMDISSGIEVPTKRARKQTEKAEQASNQSKIRFASHYSHSTRGHKQQPQSSYSHHGTASLPTATHATTTSTTSIPMMMKENKLLPSVALSNIDKASQLTLSEDQLICYGCKVRR